MGTLPKYVNTKLIPSTIKASTATAKKRVVVFAEAPATTYGIGDPYQFMPKELGNIAQKFQSLKVEDPYINTEKMNDESIKFYEEHPNASPKEKDDFNAYQTKKYTNPKFEQFNNNQNSLLSEFRSKNDALGNPSYLRKEFLSEADNVKKFYSNNPNVQVEVIPWYEGGGMKQAGLKEMKSKLSELSANDDVLIFGHSGDMLGGIKNEDIASSLTESAVKNVYLGSCGFDEHIKQGFDKSGKNIFYRSENSWFGFNPKAKTFMEGMYSRNDDNDWELTKYDLPLYQKLGEKRNGKMVVPAIASKVTNGINYRTVHEPQPIQPPKPSTKELYQQLLQLPYLPKK